MDGDDPNFSNLPVHLNAIGKTINFMFKKGAYMF